MNCVSSSGINACLEAARKNDAPIIIQFSSGGSQVKYHWLPYFFNLQRDVDVTELVFSKYFH